MGLKDIRGREYNKREMEELFVDIKSFKKILKTRKSSHLSKAEIDEINNTAETDNFNCYGYAVYSLNRNQIKNFRHSKMFSLGFSLGKFVSMSNVARDESEYIRILKHDLKSVHLKFREVGVDEKVKDGETKIAFFLEGKKVKEMPEDFHFAKQELDGNWYHKIGYHKKITMIGKNLPKVLKTQPIFGDKYRLCKCFAISYDNPNDYKLNRSNQLKINDSARNRQVLKEMVEISK